MTERELKIYAVSGLLVRIKHEKQKFYNTKDFRRKKEIKKRIKKMTNDYQELIKELGLNINP